MRSKRKEDNKEKKGKGKTTKNDKVKNTKDGTNKKAATKNKTDRKADKADKSATGQRKRQPKTTEDKPDKPSKTRRSTKNPLPETELSLTEKVIQQDELAEWVWGNNIDYSVDLTSFKKLVRSALTKFYVLPSQHLLEELQVRLDHVQWWGQEGCRHLLLFWRSAWTCHCNCLLWVCCSSDMYISELLGVFSWTQLHNSVFGCLPLDFKTFQRSIKPSRLPDLQFSHLSSLYDISVCTIANRSFD